MKKILCLLSLMVTLNAGWSQTNKNDTLVISVTSKNASVQLQADVLPDHIDLRWTKGPDDFSGYFELYRSADGIAYNIIKQFQPQSFEADQQYFTYKDEAPLRGKNYYRLIAYNKFTKEQKKIEIVADYKNQPRKLMPTVVSKGQQLNISNYNGEQLELLVFNAAGTPVFKRVVSSSIIPLANNLSGGIYVYQLVDRKNRLVSSGKFILQ
jgi:hypothetical protein